MSYVRKYIYFLLAGLTYLIIHEGVHLIQALIYGIYKGIRILPLGIEIEIIQPLTIGGFKLAAFSGFSSVVTLFIGYILLILTPKLVKLNNQPIKNYLYYVTFVFLLLDPIYISLLSLFVGGDINGIALGLNISYLAIRGIWFVVGSINVYLVSKKLYPAYIIKY